MKPYNFSFAIAVLAASLVVAPKAFGQSCKSADYTSGVVTSEIQKIATANGKLRDSLRLPLVTASQVTFVTDTVLCTRVRVALDSLITATTPDPINLGPRPIYAFKVGSFYAAVNPGSEVGEFRPVFFFDNLFSFLSLLAF